METLAAMPRCFGREILIVSMVLLILSSSASAGVHDGGVGSCRYCHIMHQSDGGVPGGPGGPGGIGGPGSAGPALLLADTASDLCLNCHALNFGAVLGLDELAPPPERGPGNFVFLLSVNLNDGPEGLTNPISGDKAGHNIEAPGHNISTDGTQPTSPGGHYPSTNLRCTSCHDPHGNSNYRFLFGLGASPGGGGNFMYGAPDATGLDLEFGAPESNNNHVAYRSGMSEWCGNCHGEYLYDHNDASSVFEHPTSEHLTDIVQQYNVYNGTADPQGGVASAAYLAEVPFEDSTAAVSSTQGPSGTSRIMCLTCHRAHASSAPYSGRWDFNVATLGEDGVISGSYPIPNPYLAPNQDPLCYKCHGNGSPFSGARPSTSPIESLSGPGAQLR